MLCVRCGCCCYQLAVVILIDPALPVKESNMEVKETGKRCRHLKGSKPGEYSCDMHDTKVYKSTPCFSHTQIEQNPKCVCRMGEYILKLYKEGKELPYGE